MQKNDTEVSRNKWTVWSIVIFVVVMAIIVGLSIWLSRSTKPENADGSSTRVVSPQAAGNFASHENEPKDGPKKTSQGLRQSNFFRDKGYDPTIVPPGPLAANIDQLEAAARAGDAKVAYALGRELMACIQLDAAYADVHDKLKNNEIKPETAQASLDGLDRKLTSCAGITPEQKSEFPHWIEMAATRGDLTAQTEYAGLLSLPLQQHMASLDSDWITDYKNKSMNFLQSASNAGDVDALDNLAFAYWDGLLTTQDKVRAYAAMQCVASSGLVKSATKMLGVFSKSMLPEELQRAQTMQGCF